MLMSEYDIELCEKLYKFREDFNENDITCYWMLFVIANEIIANPREEIGFNVKENLKTTFEVLLNFYDFLDENIITLDENIDINNIEDCVKIINLINNIYNAENDFIINNNNFISFLNLLTKNIESNINEYSSFQNKKNSINQYEEILFSGYKNPNYLKEYLIRKQLIKYECDECGLIEWQNEPLGLILDFKDGDENNQNLDNLRFLCPNCYSQIGRI